MFVLIQRVKRAAVTIDDKTVGEIGMGLLVFVGAVKGDTEEDVSKLAGKIRDLRIFQDENSKMNLSVADVGGSVLVVSQFTLAADCKKGRRPSFDDAAPPDIAERLCNLFAEEFRKRGLHTETGRFAAHMQVEILNDGPVTIWLDSRWTG